MVKYNYYSNIIKGNEMSIVTLALSNYIMIAELLGLWGLLASNVFLNKRTIKVTRVVIILIFIEAICWAVERYTR